MSLSSDVPTTRSGLDETARKRGLRVLLISTFFAWGGFFMVVPLISVHYVDGLGWAAASIGLVLAVRQFTQQGLILFSGALADRLGAKGLICVGMLLRAIGFLTMANADTYPRLMFSIVLAAIGGALFESPRAAAIAALTTEAERVRFYSLAGVAGGLGVTIGTQTGALLIRTDFALVSIASAVCFFAIFLMMLLVLPPVRPSHGSSTVWLGIGVALRDRPFMSYNLLMMGHWFIWTQYAIALPLAATDISGSANAVAWVYAVNAATTVLLGFPLPRLVDRYLHAKAVLVLGTAIMALGLGAIGFAPTTVWLMMAVFIYSLGTVLTRPSEQTVTAGLANPTLFGSYFGVASLSLAVGGGVGNYAGGALYDAGQQLEQPALPWLIFGLVGLTTALGLWLTTRSSRSRADTRAAARRQPSAEDTTPD